MRISNKIIHYTNAIRTSYTHGVSGKLSLYTVNAASASKGLEVSPLPRNLWREIALEALAAAAVGPPQHVAFVVHLLEQGHDMLFGYGRGGMTVGGVLRIGDVRRSDVFAAMPRPRINLAVVGAREEDHEATRTRLDAPVWPKG